MKISVELTDTYGGEANYSWCRRAEIVADKPLSRLAVVRRAKKAVGLSGVRCETTNYGDVLELRPYGLCAICFITFPN